jgi:gliding motility-associated-like protein
VNPLPLPNAAPDTTICIDKTAMLRAYNGISYLWSPAATLSSANTAVTLANPPVGTTKYYVIVTDVLGCKGYDSVTILKQDSIFLSYANTGEICLGNDFKFAANSDAHSFQWLPVTGVSDPTLLNPFLFPLVNTDYQLTAYSNNSCPNKVATISVKVDPLPTVKAVAQYTPVLYPGQIVTLDAVTSPDVISYLWQSNRSIVNPASKTIFWNADTTRTFKISVHNQYNCLATDSITVDVFCFEGNIYLPTSFTPNGDGKNDYFRPLSSYKTNSMIKKFIIFNRWGQIVYSIHDMPIHDIQGWNGNYPANTNQTSGSATYVWYMEFTCNGSQSFSKGTVVLIK